MNSTEVIVPIEEVSGASFRNGFRKESVVMSMCYT